MKQLILTKFPWPWMPSLALLIFFCFFTAMCFAVFAKSRRSFFAKVEQIPLNDGEKL